MTALLDRSGLVWLVTQAIWLLIKQIADFLLYPSFFHWLHFCHICRLSLFNIILLISGDFFTLLTLLYFKVKMLKLTTCLWTDLKHICLVSCNIPKKIICSTVNKAVLPLYQINNTGSYIVTLQPKLYTFLIKIYYTKTVVHHSIHRLLCFNFYALMYCFWHISNGGLKKTSLFNGWPCKNTENVPKEFILQELLTATIITNQKLFSLHDAKSVLN